MGFIIRGCIWDIPILIFAYVLFWGPIIWFIGFRELAFRVSSLVSSKKPPSKDSSLLQSPVKCPV